MEPSDKIVRPGSRPEPQDNPHSVGHDPEHEAGMPAGARYDDDAMAPRRNGRRNVPLPVVVLILGLLALGVAAFVALSRLSDTRDQQADMPVAAPLVPLPAPEVSTTVPVAPAVVTETTPEPAAPVVPKAPAPKPATQPTPRPVTEPAQPTQQPARPEARNRLPRGLQGVIQPQDWRAVKPALAFAFSQGDDDAPVDWANDRNGHSGVVVQSGTGTDERGCRQYRVIDDANPGNRGYVDVCPSNDW